MIFYKFFSFILVEPLHWLNNVKPYDFFLYQVEHGCTIATIGGVRGILVAGGATGDDVVEFFDWEEQTEWKTIGKMNRGRGMKF